MLQNYRLRLLAILALLIGPSSLPASDQDAHVTVTREGLVLIACTRDGFVFGTDSASANADGTLSEVQKMFPVGKHVAILLAGATSIQDPMDRPVRQQLNIVRIAQAWIEAHPDADISMANREINAAVLQALTAFFAAREHRSESKRYAFSIILAGFDDDKLAIMQTVYGLPANGAAPGAEVIPHETKPGSLSMFGENGVAERLLRRDPGPLRKFESASSLKKYHSDARNLSAQDFLSLFHVLLQASESPEGKQAHQSLGPVAPPNHFATLTLEKGFQVQ